jgi:hypothetical protein
LVDFIICKLPLQKGSDASASFHCLYTREADAARRLFYGHGRLLWARATDYDMCGPLRLSL